MKRSFAVLIVVLMAGWAWTEASARAGGGVSVGRSAPSISRAPSFSHPPAPRYSAPATPAPRAPVTNNTTIVQGGGSGGGGGFGSSFLGGAAGAVVGNALSRPSGAVVAAPGTAAAIPSGGVAGSPAPAVVVQDSSSWGWFWFLILACLAVGGLVWFSLRRKEREPMDEETFDPLQFFYSVQQAAMRDDLPALNRLCTRGMATVLSGNAEPERIATKTLTGVVHQWADEDSIEYRFTDTVEGKRVREMWQLSNGRLAGIEVVPQ